MSQNVDVIFLGTGGGAPSPKRYLPAVALRFGGKWLLFDAGEGVQMRLRESPLGWGGLQGVFISHLHGDHVLGLPGLLMSLGMARVETPLALYGPAGLEELIHAVLRGCRVQLPFPLHIHTIEGDGGVLIEGDDWKVEAAPLLHRIPCYGFFWSEGERPGRFYPDQAAALGIPPGPLYGQLQSGCPVTAPDGAVIGPERVMGPSRAGRKIAYCTDTAPCDVVLRNAEGADLLIHDCTFAADLDDEARISGHSTTVQAAQQALQAGCRRLALTHISARYTDDDLLLTEARAIFPHTFVARDLLSVSIPARKD
ncbi:MAG: ribonuclease Z [Armatimonadota bacterium]|nr:ribonuclease Z [Armatimonadota bacterium]